MANFLVRASTMQADMAVVSWLSRVIAGNPMSAKSTQSIILRGEVDGR